MSTRPPNPDLAEVLGRENSDKRIDILRLIGSSGSISEAARRAGVSYKAAWQAIETLGNLAGTPMVEKAVGGTGGGGTALTPAGHRVLEAARLLDQARGDVLARLEPGARGSPGGAGLAALALRTSLRNQLPCQVTAVLAAGAGVRVGLDLGAGTVLHARITRESVQLLQLQPGLPALALFKATAVQVAPSLDGAGLRNLLTGQVLRASRSLKGGEVTLRLAAGASVVGFAAAGAPLKVGALAMAGIEESAVVVALTA